MPNLQQTEREPRSRRKLRERTGAALVLLLALAGIVIRSSTLYHRQRGQLCGADFPVLYAAGRLAGSPEVYSAAAVQALDRQVMGCATASGVFIRLPYFAWMMKPWSLLPFWPAFWMWRLASVGAVGVFIWLWPAPRRWSLLACAWSLPLSFTLTNGQDSAFLLLWIAAAVCLVSRGREFAAGLALAMCAAKFHLFLLLPLLLIRRPRVMTGVVAGGAVLLVLCFALQDPGWPRSFLAAASNPIIDPNPGALFNLRGIAHGSLVLELALAVSVVLAVAYVTRYADFHLGMASVLAGGILLSRHITTSDLVLLIPAALVLAFHQDARYSKVLAVFLITPLAYFLLVTEQILEIPRLLALLLLYLMALEVRPRLLSPQLAPQLHP